MQLHLESSYEAEQSLESQLRGIKEKGIRTGVVINPTTDERQSVLGSLVEQGLVDNILVMTVQPGFGG